MRRGVGVVLLGCALLLGGGMALAAADGHYLSADELKEEAARNHVLRDYMARNGTPDVAEARVLADRPPWDDHEVVLYYFDRRLELGFARAYILGKPDVEIERYERPLSEQRISALASHAQSRPGAPMELASASGSSHYGPADRAEASARRAEDAAGRVESAAVDVEQAADRTEAIVARMERSSAPARRH